MTWVMASSLDTLFGHRNHRVLGDLCAGASGGGQRDHGQRGVVKRASGSHDLQIVLRRGRAGDQCRQCLAKINHRAAAQGDNDIRGKPFEVGQGPFDIGQAGFGFAGKGPHRQSGLFAPVDQPFCPSHGRPVDQQHIAPECFCQIGGLRALSPAKVDRLGAEE